MPVDKLFFTTSTIPTPSYRQSRGKRKRVPSYGSRHDSERLGMQSSETSNGADASPLFEPGGSAESPGHMAHDDMGSVMEHEALHETGTSTYDNFEIDDNEHTYTPYELDDGGDRTRTDLLPSEPNNDLSDDMVDEQPLQEQASIANDTEVYIKQENQESSSVHPHAQRYTYRDMKGVLREIWQPGDPDGDRDGEVFESINPPSRFRFLQHDFGSIIRGRNSPPKYVVLDDKAAYDLLQSKAYSAKDLGRFWYHDFAAAGTLRTGRLNRGRAALVAEPLGEMIDTGDRQGPRSTGWTYVGNNKNKKYHFSGERNGYEPVQFVTPSFEVPVPSIEKDTSWNQSHSGDMPPPPPHASKYKRQRVNTYFRATPSPEQTSYGRREHLMGGKTAYGGGSTTYSGNDYDDLIDQIAPLPAGYGDDDEGRKTVYAGMSYAVDDDGTSDARTPSQSYDRNVSHKPKQAYSMGGNKTPRHAQTSFISLESHEALEERVRRIEQTVRDTTEALTARDEEIESLKSKIVELEEKVFHSASTIKGRHDEPHIKIEEGEMLERSE